MIPLRLFLVGTSLLLMAGIRCAQAGEITIVSPSGYDDTEGEGATNDNCCDPFHAQQVFPAEDFAALGNKPHWLVDITFRPDQSVTSPRTVHDPDSEIRLTTMPVGPPNLSLRFEDNLGSNFKHWYLGPLTLVAGASGPGPGPREFYHAERPAGVTPYLYDPSQGNLLFDVIAWQGLSPSHRNDRTLSTQTALAGSPFATHGGPNTAAIFQFTFVPMLTGDYNQNGAVEQSDLDLVLLNWGRNGTSPPAGWLSDLPTGNIDQGELDGVLLNWGSHTTFAAVPEPSSIALTILAMVGGGAYFVRRSRAR